MTADGSYLQATRDVLHKYGGLWFNDEAFVVSAGLSGSYPARPCPKSFARSSTRS